MPGLKFTVLRLPTVYGSGDRGSMVQRIMVAGIYRKLGETMKLLWNAGYKVNTVHVEDVCRAIWFVLNRDDTIGEVSYLSIIWYVFSIYCDLTQFGASHFYISQIIVNL